MGMEVSGIPFDGYATSLHGMKLGTVMKDEETGKRFQLVQMHTAAAVGSAVVQGTSICAYVDLDAYTVTDDVSATLETTHPRVAGFAGSACPVSTGSVTYYFWVQIDGPVHTTLTGTTLATIVTNGDNDITDGDALILTATDNTVDSVAAGTASDVSKTCGYAIGDDGTAVVNAYAKCTAL